MFDALFWRIAIIAASCFCLTLCGVVSQSVHAATTELNISTGSTTKVIKRVAHTKGSDRYSIDAVGVRFENDFELSIIKHKYHVNSDHFSTVSIGLTKHWTLERGIFFLDCGLGLRYTEKDRRIKWLVHKHLMSDFSGAIGLRLWGDFGKASIGLRHFSCPGSDTGMNVDEVMLTFNIPF